MILRVRLPDGRTERVTLAAGEGEDKLRATIQALADFEGDFDLFADLKFESLFVPAAASHGDFVYVKGKLTAAPEEGVVEGEEEDEKDWRPRCRHGPRGMCEHCMPKEDKRARYKSELAKWKGRGMSVAVMEAMEALKVAIKPQEEAGAQAAAVASDAASAFQSYLAETGFSQQRVGVCYGSVTAEMETEVLAIFEPPQRGGEDVYALADESEAGDIGARASRVADMLGLKKVGTVFSARPRKCILSGQDVVFAARVASELPLAKRKSFIVMVVSTTETSETMFEAYQISDQAIEMFEAGIFEDEDQQKPNSGRVLCKEEVLVEGKDAKKVHTEFFLLNIPIKSCDSWLRTSFAIESRDLAPQDPSDLKKAISDTSVPYHKRLADFHLLLYLSNMFDMDSDMPGLLEAAKEQRDDVGEGYRLMIDSMASA